MVKKKTTPKKGSSKGSSPKPKHPPCGEFGGVVRHGERKGKPCKNAAGQGTSHTGQGMCRKHGGNDGPLKHGRNSKFRDEQGRSIYSLPFLDEAKRGKMEDDVAAIRALALRLQADFSKILDRAIPRKAEEKQKHQQDIDSLLARLASMIERANRMDERTQKIQIGNRMMISVEEVTGFFQRLIVALISHGIDPEIVKRMATIAADMGFEGEGS